MKIYNTLNIGEFHTNYCEDFLIEEQIGANEKLIAVFDGCTMGIESVFESMLLGKILKNIAKQQFYEEFVNRDPTPLKDKSKQKTENEIIEYLLVDNRGAEYHNFLERKVQELKEIWNHVVTDDLATIRIKAR